MKVLPRFCCKLVKSHFSKAFFNEYSRDKRDSPAVSDLF